MTATKKLFAEFNNNVVLIETGSGDGDGIQCAIDAGFETVYSLEKSKELYQYCKARFLNNIKVCCYHGDSRDKLPNLISHIPTTITFWLDAHYSKGKTLGEGDNPILDELFIISKHRLNNHNILIDDMRYFGNPYFGVTEEQVRNELMKINPNYTIEYRDGFCRDDVLVAYLKEGDSES